MKRYLHILIATLLATFFACTDSALEEWEPYLLNETTASISVDNGTVNVDASSNTASVKVTSDGRWTAAASDEWISLSATSGSLSQTVTITVAENMTTSSRSGKVTFTASSGKTAVVSITQDAKTLTVDPASLSFKAEGETKSITVTSNGTYTWDKEAVAKWLTITLGYAGLDVKADKNADPEQRSDTIAIFMEGVTMDPVNVVVTQFGVGYTFAVDRESIDVQHSKEEACIIQLTTNDSWTAEASDSWIGISKASGKGSQAITIAIAENNTRYERSGTITLKGDKCNITKIISVTQKGKYLTVEPHEVSIANTGGKASVNVATDGKYTVTPNVNWISVDTARNVITITAAKNPETYSRTGAVNVQLTGLVGEPLSEGISVTQAETVYSFRVDSTSLVASSVPTTRTFRLTTNDDWTAKVSANWFTLSASSGSGDKTFTVSIKDNASTNARNGSITLTGTHSGSITIPVSQKGRYLSVEPDNLTFANTGGSESVAVNTDGTYSVSDNASWITVTKNGNRLTIAAAENTSISSRSGSVTVSLTGLSSGSLSRVISVSQHGANVVAPTVSPTSFSVTSEASNQSITITSNAGWTASKDASWITLSSSNGAGNANISISIAENKTPNARTGTITIQNSAGSAKVSVTQAGKYLMVSPESLSFGTEGGTKTVAVNTDGTFTTTKDASWLTVSTSGNTITVKASANTSTTSRSGTVTVSMTGLTSGSIVREIAVTQNGAAVEAPTVNPSTITMSSGAGSRSVSIASNASWTASKDASWITLSLSSGSGNADITLSVTENKTTSARTGTITVQNSAGSAKVTVTQDGKYLTVSPDNLTFDAGGGSENVTVTTDGSYTTSKNVNWITVSTSGNIITIKADANTSTIARSGKVTVSMTGLTSGSLERVISVTQSGAAVVAPTVSPANIEVASSSTSRSLAITSNASWTASDDASWITLSSTSGSGNANVSVNMTENTTPNTRTGTITVQNSAGSARVTVTQNGKYLTVSSESLSFEALGGSKSVSVSTDGTFETSKSDSWISVSRNGNNITISTTANTSTTSRSGTVTVSLTGLSSGSLSRVINITQNGEAVEAPSVSPASISFASAAASKSVSVTSNASWAASDDASWITLSSSSGSGNGSITISAAENTTPNARTGTVTVQNSAGTARVSVTQAGKFLTVSPENLSFDAEGGTSTVSVSTDGTFTTSKSASWITVSTSGNTISVTTSANTSTDSRSGTVTVSLTGLASGSLSRTINVKQSGKGGVSFEDYGELEPLD